jgi:hypothetical protein
MECNAARITSSLHYFCLEFGDGRKNEKADPSDPQNKEERYVFDAEIAVVCGADFSPALKWVLADGVVALEQLGKIKVPDQFNIDPGHNPFVMPAAVTLSKKPESYAQYILSGAAYPDGSTSWKMRTKQGDENGPRPDVDVVVFDTVAGALEAGQFSLEFGFAGGRGAPARTSKLTLAPDLVWQATTLVSDMIFAWRSVYGQFRLRDTPARIERKDASRLGRTLYSPETISRMLKAPDAV